MMTTRFRSACFCVFLLSAAACAPSRLVMREGREMPAEDAARLDFQNGEDAAARGKMDEALRWYKTASTYYPETFSASQALLKMGQIEMGRGNYQAGREAFEQFLEKHPGREGAMDARFSLAMCDYRLGKYNDAIQSLQSLVREGMETGRDTIASYTIAESYYAQKKYLDAARWYSRSWSLMADPLAKEGAGETIKDIVLTRLSPSELEDVAREFPGVFPGDIATFQLALRLMDGKKFSQAGQLFGDFLNSYGSHELAPRARAMLARIERRSVVKKNTLGVVLPLSGKSFLYGEKALKGIMLAVRAFDPAGHDPVELVIRDTQGVPARAAEAVEQVVFDTGAMAVVGPLLSVTSEAAAFRAQDLGIPLISLSQKEGLSGIGPFVFRNSVLPAQQARTLVGYAMDSLGLKSFGILYPRDTYGEDLMRA